MTEATLEQAPSAEDRRRLRRLPLFANASDSTIHDLLAFTPVATIGRNQFAVREGATPNSLLAVVSGRFALMTQAAGEQPQVIAMAESGELIMAAAAIAATPYPLTARATEEGRVAGFPLATLWSAADRDHGFAADLARVACGEWREMVEQLKDYRLRSAPQRFAAHLVRLATAAGQPHQGAAEIELIEDRKTLASLLGMTPENLSRTIAQFRERGVVVTGRAVAIADIGALAAFAGA
ncbi:MAG TPA: helix-turn-helix domain-containing protein [Dongiaceae bacterium]|jgi:CRP/FNR family transcriptional activator FtrB|nr:helix-turn-helix domain-containing protein [Dongiaceae bacterium]